MKIFLLFNWQHSIWLTPFSSSRIVHSSSDISLKIKLQSLTPLWSFEGLLFLADRDFPNRPESRHQIFPKTFPTGSYVIEWGDSATRLHLNSLSKHSIWVREREMDALTRKDLKREASVSSGGYRSSNRPGIKTTAYLDNIYHPIKI